MNLTQTNSLLAMQNAMNAKVNPAWLTARYPWLRAVVVECAEAMEHYGWKWWKKQETDVVQLRIELVDIFHFALSDIIVMCQGDYAAAASFLQRAMGLPTDMVSDGYEHHAMLNCTVLDKLELMSKMAAERMFSIPLLASIMGDVAMSWDDMFTGYVSMNVLNNFRQDHGYKAGTYRKDWNGAEDNVRLAEIAVTMDPAAEGFASELYNQLKVRYEALPPQEW